ncbi:hypothetical protein DV453_005098 [Geotrichum candidum]|nr:hypothetical protein DV453_005098 [Geotrichum candidum]
MPASSYQVPVYLFVSARHFGADFVFWYLVAHFVSRYFSSDFVFWYLGTHFVFWHLVPILSLLGLLRPASSRPGTSVPTLSSGTSVPASFLLGISVPT